MKTPPPDESREAGQRGPRRGSGVRPRRAPGSAITGFGNVLNDVRTGPLGTASAGGTGANAHLSSSSLVRNSATRAKGDFNERMSDQATKPESNTPANTPAPTPTPTPSQASAPPHSQSTAAAPTSTPASAVPATASASGSVSGPTNLSTSSEATEQKSLGRLNTSQLLTKVIDEALLLEIAAASKELHVELEPINLGPLVVRLLRGNDGRVEINFKARQANTAKLLDSGTEILRDRLTDAGVSTGRISVEYDAELELSR